MQTLADINFTFISHGSPEYQAMLTLRNNILRRPIGLTLKPEEVEADKADKLICGYIGGEIAACLIFKDEGNRLCRYRQIAVAEKHQGKGVGTALISFADDYAKRHGFSDVFIKSRVEAVKFYEKFGFRTVGDVFTEVTLPHIRMEKKLV